MIDIFFHIPAIITFLPVIIAVLIFFFNKDNLSKYLYCLYSVIFIALSIIITKYIKAIDGHTLTYNLGNFDQSIGITFEINLFSAACIMFLSFCNLLYTACTLLNFFRMNAYHTGLSICVIGALTGLCITNDMFNFYVFIELASIASYILCINPRNKESYLSALSYLIVGSIAGCFILLGIGFLYASFGTLNISEIRDYITHANSFGDLTLYSFIMIITGLLIKTGMTPFHRWYFNIHKSSTPTTLGFFSFTNSSVMLLMIVKIVYIVYGMNFVFSMTKYIINITYALAIASIVIGSVKALNTKTLPKFIVWSTISQVGYLIIGFLSDNELILIGSLMQILSNAISKIILFAIYQKTYDQYTGLGLVKIKILEKCDFSGIRIPVIFIIINMAGLPMTIGFISKIHMIIGCVSEEKISTLIIIILGSILSAIYIIKIIEPVIIGNKSSSIQENIILISENIYTRITFLFVSIILIFLPFSRKFTIFIKMVSDYLLNIS